MPELADICNLTTKKLFGVFSENMAMDNYIVLAQAIGEEIANGADGIVIGHGTDTMGHTAAILSFMVQDSPVPIVVVGSQRSSDRPSSDAALNLIHAVRTAAYGDIAEVMIAMFGPTSDRYGLLHRGTRCRKMHSSYRSTFRTIGDIPLAMVSRDSFTYLSKDFSKRDMTRQVKIDAVYDDRTTILYYYPGMHPDLVDALVEKGYHGIVIAGTGLGHVNKPLYPALKRAIEQGVHVVMAVQTLWGYAQMYVYDTGRDLLDIGIVPLDNMLPETALMKLSWVLAHTRDHAEVARMMRTPSPTRSPPASPTTATSSCRAASPRSRSGSRPTGSEGRGKRGEGRAPPSPPGVTASSASPLALPSPLSPGWEGGGQSNRPAMQALTKFAREPAMRARTPSLARSGCREGASGPIPPIWMPIEPMLAKPHRA